MAAAKGFSPAVFNVYETYRGFNDSGPHWNLVLRFSEDQIEVPLDLAVSDEEAKRSEAESWGNESNPCFPNLQTHGKATPDADIGPPK